MPYETRQDIAFVEFDLWIIFLVIFRCNWSLMETQILDHMVLQSVLSFFSIFCLRFSVEKEWVFCCFQLGKNGFRGLRVSLRVFFGAVKLMKF